MKTSILINILLIWVIIFFSSCKSVQHEENVLYDKSSEESLVSKAQKNKNEMRIAIIGAGVSGLTAAHTLN